MSDGWRGVAGPGSVGVPPSPDKTWGYPITPSTGPGQDLAGQDQTVPLFPRGGQTNKLKTLPSRRTTYAGGNKNVHTAFI